MGARRARPLVFWGLFAAGAGVNALGALQPDSVSTWYYAVLPRSILTEAEAAKYPGFAVERDSRGTPQLLQFHSVHSRAAFSPIRLSAWLLGVRLSSADPLAALESPPWDTKLEGQNVAIPPERAIPDSALVFLTSGFRWPHLGMSLFRGAGERDTALAYVDCVYDQALRAQDMRDGERSVEYGARLYSMVPGAQAAVTYAEGLRIAGRHETLYAFVRDLPESQKSTPDFGLSWALLARDRGERDRAIKIVQRVAKMDTRPAVQAFASKPPEEWPSTLRDILRRRE